MPIQVPWLRRLLAEGVDTRFTLHMYAAIAVVTGLSVTGTGCRGLPGIPLSKASLIYLAGMVIAAAGCAASGLALNDDPVGRRRSLVRFAIGHLLLGVMVLWQFPIYWSDQGLPLGVAAAPLAVGALLLTTVLPSLLRDTQDAGLHSGRRVRSTYDEHVRQIARREERARLARDLHDAVKQQLFVIQTAAATAQARFDADAAGAREALAHVRTAAREATTEMEALLDELQAAPMENTGLVEALRKQCEALALRTGAEVAFKPGSLPSPGTLPPGAHDAIYRVAQEALANVARHARARRVTVSLNASQSDVELRVSDDGSGFDRGAPRSGMGTSNMESRAAEFDGRLSITGASSGTDVVLVVPLTNGVARLVDYPQLALLGLLVLNYAVFYGLRGWSPEQPTSTVVLWLFGAWAVWSFVSARRARRRKAP
jgi:signal transduction histidine kinase